MPRRTAVILSVLVALLALSNAGLFFLYNRSLAEQRAMLVLLNKTSTELEALSTEDIPPDSAVKLGEIERQLNKRLALLSPQQPPPNAQTMLSSLNLSDSSGSNSSTGSGLPVSEPSGSGVSPAALSLGALQNVSALVTGRTGEYALVVEKDANLLHLFRFEKNGVRLIKTIPCVVGKNKRDKQREGDMATPVGVYFLISSLPDKSLAELYGAGAFVLNYPSLFDYKNGKEGFGIWLHGHPRNQKLGEDKTSTRGCIVVSNENLLELATKIQVLKTPIVITERAVVVSPQQAAKTQKEVMDFLENWRLAWESKDIEKFISLYAPGYINNLRMSLREFRAQKARSAAAKSYIKVGISGVFILTAGRSDDIFVVKFGQNYRSDKYSSVSNKLLYIQKKNGVWKVIGESVY